MTVQSRAPRPLSEVLNPKSIAVVGASHRREKIGNIVFRNLVTSFSGRLFPVNETGTDVEGRKAYPSLTAVEGAVDLAVVVVPRDSVLQVMSDAAKKQVKGAVVITSGFREVDQRGADLEAELLQVARTAGVRVFGPNTLGLITPAFNATFAFQDVPRGKIALVAQSGGLGMYMLEWAQRSKSGISYFVSLGNQCDVSESEVLDFLADDPLTRVAFVYLESVKDGGTFLRLVPRAAALRPVIFLKGGMGKRGSEAAKTHTGSLAGSVAVFRAAVNAVGGILAEDLEDALNLSRLLIGEEAVKPELLVVTNSGGHGVLTADEAERRSIRLAPLPAKTEERLASILPPYVRPANPLDLSGDANLERYRGVMSEIQEVDCTKLVLVQALPLLTCVEVAKALAAYKGKSVVGVMMGTDEDAAMELLDQRGIPSFKFPEDAVRAVAHYAAKPVARTKVRDPRPPEKAAALVAGKGSLTDRDGLRLMELYGIGTPKYRVVSSPEDAVAAAREIGYPVVMKISPDEPVHKTELKGVAMNLADPEQARNAFASLSKITPRVTVQQQVSGLEVLLGAVDDPTFGKAVLVTAGGIYAEVVGTPSHRLAPLTEDEAREMLLESRVHAMVNARSRGYDEASLVRTVVTFSRLVVDLPVKEMDLNPVIVNADGAFAVDVRTIFGQRR